MIGANGAGKSTAIKLLTGELIPTKGEVERHPNLRMAYVAQHAFQHLEKHLTQTPVQYILERFAGSDDKEAIDFKAEVVVKEKKKYFLNANNELKPCEEQKDFAKAIDPEAILDRRENKKEKTKEYQTKLMNKSIEDAIWIERTVLEKMGMLAKVRPSSSVPRSRALGEAASCCLSRGSRTRAQRWRRRWRTSSA